MSSNINWIIQKGVINLCIYSILMLSLSKQLEIPLRWHNTVLKNLGVCLGISEELNEEDSELHG